MNMKKTIPAVLTVLLICGVVSAGERWLHVRIQESGYDDDSISINVPLRMVEALVPKIETRELRHGRFRWNGDRPYDGIDLHELLLAVRDAPDSEFVTLRSRDESVRVAKENGLLLIHVDENHGDRVRVRVPIEVIEAMLDGNRGELDLVAGLRALAEHDIGDLVVVESDDNSTVRIWIDTTEAGN